jgi:DNA-binding NarL/FixJ family response regulator
MAVDVSPPSAPTGLNGTVNDGRLTLRWTPGAVENGSVANFVVFGDDTPLVNLGATQFEAQVGPYDPADPRTYSVVQTSDIGTTSPRSQAVKVLPRIVGLTLESARAALAAKGFVSGDAVVVDSAQPMGLVVGPANLVTAPVGSTIPLQVSAGSGGAPGTKFVFNVVGTRRLPLSKRNFIGIHIASTRATTLTATLVNAKGARVYTWNEKARAGASIVKLTLPKQARKTGTYTLLWTAVSGTETMRKSITVKITEKLAPKVAATKPVDVILTGESLPKELPIQTAQEQRLIPATSGDTTFSVTGDPKRNVQVIVVDADEYGLSLVHDLRTVFPMVKLIALTNDPSKLSRAIKAGATLALPKKTSTDKLAKVVSSLSGNTPRIPASSGTKRR